MSNKYFSIRILSKSESNNETEPVAAYVVDQDALIMISRIAEQAQAGIIKRLILENSETLK